MVDNGSDEQLGVLLDSALRGGLRDGQVDVGALTQGSRQRARQIRHRRVAAVSGIAALVVAVPVGYQVISDHPNGSTHADTAALIPSGAARLPAAFTAAELPAGMTLASTSKTVDGPVPGLSCDWPRAPKAGQRWVWKGSNGATVTLTVTRWASAAPVLNDVVKGAACQWSEPPVNEARGTIDGSDYWAAGVGTSLRALLRSGNSIAGIQVTGLSSTTLAELARTEADRLG